MRGNTNPQYDIELVHNIEQYTGTPLALCPEVEEDDVLKLLNQVAKASRVAKMRLMEQVGRLGARGGLWVELCRSCGRYVHRVGLFCCGVLAPRGGGCVART